MGNSAVLYIVCISSFYTLSTLSHEIKIGGLFLESNHLQKAAFKHAVDEINADPNILSHTNLTAVVQQFTELDSFHVCRTVCNMMTDGMVAIFGPSSREISEHVQSICDRLEVPHLEMKWHVGPRRQSYLVNLYPHPSDLDKALSEILRVWEWKTFTIFYEDNESLMRMTELLKHKPTGTEVTLRQLKPGNNYRPLLTESKYKNEVNFVLDCSVDRIYDILIQAQQVGLMASYHSYIITSFDLHTVDLTPFKYSGTNITGLRLMDPKDPNVIKTVDNWVIEENGKSVKVTANRIRVEAAILFDAVKLLAYALHQLHNEHEVEFKSLNCETEENWPYGNSLIKNMRMNEFRGLTGLVKFDSKGFRTDFALDILELTKIGLKKVGTWSSAKGVNINKTYHPHTADDGSTFNRTFVLTTLMSHPYFMIKEATTQLKGNERFEGFVVDLIDEISKILHFSYTFKLVHDEMHGTWDEDKSQWTGMIKELLEGTADFAVSDLTITSERESAVDFTMPFLNLGISILYRKPTKEPPRLLSFMSPFSKEVWICIMAAYIGVSLLLFALARFSIDEWNNPYPCNEKPEKLENQFTFKNSFWFTIGSLMQQGSDIAPIALSTRMVACIWWFFTLIMVSSYTANLAAFLTIESMSSPINNIKDLVNQNKIQYGAMYGGSTSSFFKSSSNEIYKRIWNFMEANPEVFSSSNSEGVQRVEREEYAFFMESTTIEYHMERRCSLAQVNGLLDSKGYGIAMRKDSPYRNYLSAAVLELQERGELKRLKSKWWKEKKGGGTCTINPKSSTMVAELGLANVGGVFVVLIGGVGIAAIISCLEFLCKLRKTARMDTVICQLTAKGVTTEDPSS